MGFGRRTTIVGFRRTTAVKKENDRGWETRIAQNKQQWWAFKGIKTMVGLIL